MEKKIREIAHIMKDTGVTLVEVTQQDGTVLHLERMQPATSYQLQVPEIAPKTEITSPELSQGPAQEVVKTSQDLVETFETIQSPMVGLFYASSSPEAEPYVKVGDYVQAGDVVCLIEAMKLFNEITAEATGKVAEICVNNGQVVEYGQTLIKLVKE